MNVRSIGLLPALIVLHALPAFGQQHATHNASVDSTAVVATVERFHAALATGDSATALALLAPDVVVLEAGSVETREEYRSHHLPADIAFAQAVKSDRKVRQLRTRGDVAWIMSSSVTRGTYRERAIDSAGAELMVLTRTANGWQINAIHWSSRQRRRPS